MINNLKSQIEKSSKDLKEVWTALSADLSLSLPIAWKDNWTKQSSLHSELSVAGAFLEARDVAWENIEKLLNRDHQDSDNSVRHGSRSFFVNRHLHLVAYMASTWAVYDRLANCVGRLSAVSEIASHPKQNPKLVEDLIYFKKDNGAFRICQNVKDGYAWPIQISYGLRNWLVHEGYERDNTPLFNMDVAEMNLVISDAARSKLEEDNKIYMNKSGAGKFSCLSEDEDYWKTKDLSQILPQYHGEIDAMFCSFLMWAANSFVGLVSAFGKRFHESP